MGKLDGTKDQIEREAWSSDKLLAEVVTHARQAGAGSWLLSSGAGCVALQVQSTSEGACLYCIDSFLAVEHCSGPLRHCVRAEDYKKRSDAEVMRRCATTECSSYMVGSKQRGYMRSCDLTSITSVVFGHESFFPGPCL